MFNILLTNRIKLIGKKGFFRLLFFFFLGASGIAQYSNSLYFNYSPINPVDSQKLFLNINNANFLNNNEFFNKFVEGYTLIGFHLTPELVYYPTSRIRLKAGVHLLKYYGLEKFSRAIPTFSFYYKLTPSLSMVFGSLYGTANHELIEPIYEFERFFIKNSESGIQFLLSNRIIKSDTWLNWEKFILEGDPFQEVFVVGTSNLIKLSDPQSKTQFNLPVQAIVSHKGGQINSIEANVQTIINSATGVSIKHHFVNSGFGSIEFSNFFLTFNDISNTLKLPYSRGWAVYSNLIAEWKNLTFGAGYWYGNQYITNRGCPVFQSMSVSNPLYYEQIRQLITSKIIFNKRIGKEIKIGLRMETYYDLINRKLDYTYGLHILYNQRFFLKKT